MDKKKSFLNVGVSLIFKVLTLIGGIVIRRFLIEFAGDEINGLNSLYVSIVGFLSIAELGVGSAIVYCMYKPIVDGDENKVSALYGLFSKLYFIIGIIVFVIGCCVVPILPYIATGYSGDLLKLYLTFILFLISVVLTYFYSAKISLINAYKNNFVTTIILSSGLLLQYVLQIVALYVTQSFILYLICAIVAASVQWVITEVVTRKMYRTIIKNKQSIDVETKKDVVKNAKAVFMHKIGNILVNSADSIIISMFIGVVLLGKYNNYTIIVSSMVGVITLFFSPLTSIIGHTFLMEDKNAIKKYFNFFHTFNFIVGVIFFLGYYATIDNLVTLCFGSNLELDKNISFIITLNYFIQYMRQATLLFRDATGTFYNDRWKPLIEGVLNIALSIGLVFLFGYLFGEDFAVVGVIVPTIITNLAISHIVEPYVFYRYALKDKVAKYYFRNYIYIFVFSLALVVLHFCLQSYSNQWKELFLNGLISLAISFVICIIVAFMDKDFRHYFKNFLTKIGAKLKAKSKDDHT